MQLKGNSSLQGLFTGKHTLVAFAMVLAPTLVYGQTQAGTLDASFGSGGTVTTDLAGAGDGAAAVAIQPDGKIVVAGGSVIGYFNDFALARYNVDGTLDSSTSTAVSNLHWRNTTPLVRSTPASARVAN